MHEVVIYDVTQDSWALARCAFLPTIGIFVWFILTAHSKFATDAKVRRDNFGVRVFILGFTGLVGILTLSAELNARAKLRKHETLEACGTLHGLTKHGRDGAGERFYVGSTPFVTDQSGTPGFHGPLAKSKWVDGAEPLRAWYVLEHGNGTILRLAEASDDCGLPPLQTK